tara:strand:+ start:484 stop:816 length:333 start_codon:yes stop_codon:yes gene_type:complete
MKNKKKLSFYSTNPDFKPEKLTNPDDFKIEPKNQSLEVWIDKHRAGKTAVIIKKFIGSKEDIKDLAKKIKTHCGVGGSVKNNEIIIQGNVRDKVMGILKEKGYKFKRVGG